MRFDEWIRGIKCGLLLAAIAWAVVAGGIALILAAW